jgi:Zn-dependent protease
MRDSIRFGRVAGIPVGMHWSLAVVVVLLTMNLATALSATVDGVTVLVALLAALGLFASVLAHELAHALVARHHGVGVDGITLWMLGGVARLDGEFPTPRTQLRVAVAGPAMSVALGLAFGAAAVGGGVLGLPVLVVSAAGWLAAVNLVLAVFNLVPAAPLDGGRVLAALLWSHHGDRERASSTAARVGRCFGWALVAYGVWGFASGGGSGLWPALLGGFIVATASAELHVASVRSRLRGVVVRDVMTPTPEPRPGWITVDAFLERFVDGRTSVPDAFLIERWEGGTAGVVTFDRLQAVAPHARSSTRVVELAVAVERLRVASPADGLAEAWSRSGSAVMVLPHLAVLERGRVVGVVTPDAVERVAAARRPVSRARGRL